jgi:hypothetical protein
MENNLLNCSVNSNFNITVGDVPCQTGGGDVINDLVYHGGETTGCWEYWQNWHYPQIVQSYPVYIREKAKDNAKQAYEIIKILTDKKLVKVDKVKDFIDLMDELIKIL